MRYLLRGGLLAVLCIVKYQTAYLQSNWQQQVESLWDSTTVLRWKGIYTGQEDYFHSMIFYLSSNGKDVKGIGTYSKSDNLIYLEGTESNSGELKLLELDTSGRVTGYITGKKIRESIRCQWMNHQKTIGRSWNLQLDNQKKNIPVHCGWNKWIRVWKGKIANKPVTLLLHKIEGDQLQGEIGFSGSNTTVHVEGTLTPRDTLVLSSLNPPGIPPEIFRLVPDNKNTWKGEWTYRNPVPQKIQLKLDQDLSLSCVEFADLNNNYHCLYPKNQNTEFNQMMERMANRWLQQVRHRLKEESDEEEPNTAKRATQTAHAWPEITFCNSECISMYWFTQSSWKPGVQYEILNYDLEKEMKIDISDLFQRGSDYSKILKNKIRHAAERLDAEAKSYFMRWFDKEGIDAFTIHSQGLEFRAPFHFVYGQVTVFIPYSELKGLIRPESIIGNLPR